MSSFKLYCDPETVTGVELYYARITAVVSHELSRLSTALGDLRHFDNVTIHE